MLDRPALLYALALLVPSTAAAADVTFVDASGQIPMTHRSFDVGGDGFGGAAWLDYDGDDDLDLFIVNGKTQPNALFRNNGDGTFTDVAVMAGVQSGTGHCAVVVGDLDNDGDPDLFLTGEGGIMDGVQSPTRLFRNDGGTFVDVTGAAGVPGAETASSSALGDIDGDGDLDLFIASMGSIVNGINHQNVLYRNDGNLTFTDISMSSGVDTAFGACAVGFTQLDDDNLLDLVVGNCNEVNFAPTPVELWHNNGDLTFTDIAGPSGVTDLGFWMGTAFGDFDNDLDIDLFLTNLGDSLPMNIAPHALLINQGDGTYQDTAPAAGVALHEFGFGNVAADFDNDGWLDLFYAGSLAPPPFSIVGPGSGSPGYAFSNNGDGTFAAPTVSVDVSAMYTSGVAQGDYNADGYIDLVIVASEFASGSRPGQPILLRNPGGSNAWLTVTTEGTTSNRDGIGARIYATAGSLQQVRERHAGTGFLSSHSPWPTFGLGTEAEAEICVRWPTGVMEEYGLFPSGQRITVVEGAGTPGDDQSCEVQVGGTGTTGGADSGGSDSAGTTSGATTTGGTTTSGGGTTTSTGTTTNGTTTTGAGEAGGSDGGSAGQTDDSDSCSCRADRPAPMWALVLLALPALRPRRRGE